MSLNIPDNVLTFGSYVFADCSSLEYVSLPQIVGEFAGQSMFSNCSNLRTVILPQNINSIYSNMFFRCTNLQEIDIPKGVTPIGEYNQEIKGETNVEIIPVSA